MPVSSNKEGEVVKSKNKAASSTMDRILTTSTTSTSSIAHEPQVARSSGLMKRLTSRIVKSTTSLRAQYRDTSMSSEKWRRGQSKRTTPSPLAAPNFDDESSQAMNKESAPQVILDTALTPFRKEQAVRVPKTQGSSARVANEKPFLNFLKSKSSFPALQSSEPASASTPTDQDFRRAEALRSRGLLSSSRRYSVLVQPVFVEEKPEGGKDGLSAADVVKHEWMKKLAELKEEETESTRGTTVEGKGLESPMYTKNAVQLSHSNQAPCNNVEHVQVVRATASSPKVHPSENASEKPKRKKSKPALPPLHLDAPSTTTENDKIREKQVTKSVLNAWKYPASPTSQLATSPHTPSTIVARPEIGNIRSREEDNKSLERELPSPPSSPSELQKESLQTTPRGHASSGISLSSPKISLKSATTSNIDTSKLANQSRDPPSPVASSPHTETAHFGFTNDAASSKASPKVNEWLRKTSITQDISHSAASVRGDGSSYAKVNGDASNRLSPTGIPLPPSPVSPVAGHRGALNVKNSGVYRSTSKSSTIPTLSPSMSSPRSSTLSPCTPTSALDACGVSDVNSLMSQAILPVEFNRDRVPIASVTLDPSTSFVSSTSSEQQPSVIVGTDNASRVSSTQIRRVEDSKVADIPRSLNVIMEKPDTESARNTGTDAMGKSIKRRETVNPEKKLANLFSRRRHTNAVPPTLSVANGLRNSSSFNSLRQSMAAGLSSRLSSKLSLSPTTEHGQSPAFTRTSPQSLSPNSPFLSPSSDVFASGAINRTALSPTMHSRASIMMHTGSIVDDESRRLSELAFLD